MHLTGDMHRAIISFDDSMAIWEELGDRSNCAWSRLNQGCWLLDRGSYCEAREALRESMRIRLGDGHVPGLIRLFEAFAELALSEAQPVRAVHLAGAASTLREAAGLHRMPGCRPPASSWLPAVRQALGEAACAQAWEAGRTLSTRDAIAVAMAEGSPCRLLAPSTGEQRTRRTVGRRVLALPAAASA